MYNINNLSNVETWRVEHCNTELNIMKQLNEGKTIIIDDKLRYRGLNTL